MPSLYDNIPEELKDLRQWVCYRIETNSEGKPTKIPINWNGGARAATDNPATWGTFDQCLSIVRRYHGVGFIVSADDPYTVIDLDHCVDASGNIEPWAKKIIQHIDSYTEFSQSGKGIHIIVRASKPGTRCRTHKHPNVEIYDHHRFFVMTGMLIPGNAGTIQPAPNEIAELYHSLFGDESTNSTDDCEDTNCATVPLSDDELIAKAKSNRKNGPLFTSLWSGDIGDYNNDESAADQALCNLLAFWTNKDAQRMDRLFQQSGLMRDKWGSARPGGTYGSLTIQRAIADCSKGYTGAKRGRPSKRKESGTSQYRDYEAPNYNPDLPEIVVSNRQLRDITAEAIAAMEAGNNPESLFIRAGSMVRLRSSETEEGIVTIIDAANPEIVRCRMSQTANYIKLTRNGDPMSVPPPNDNAKDVLALGDWPFPPLDAIVATPVVRSDGSILTDPGYDRATRLYFRPEDSFSLPDIPEAITPDDINAAREVIHDVIADFPFESTADYANAIAMMLSPVCRAAIQGCIPLAVVNAPQPGTGKGLLTRITHIIATGREPAMMTAPDNREEWRKTITTQLMQGNTIIVIDNVEHKLFDASLASVLTLTRWTDRLLGTNKSVDVPNRACFIATGNNIKLGGDLPRRCYWISINPCTSRPELRVDFRHSVLPDFVRRNRGTIVAALLTLVRAWYAAGCPAPSSPIIGSYESWSRVIGGILQHAGIPDFLGNAEERRKEASEDDLAWEGFLFAIEQVYGDGQFTTHDIDLLVGSDSDFAEALPEFLADVRRNPKLSFSRKLGNAFNKYSGKCFGENDIKIEKTDCKNYNKVHWSIKTNTCLRSIVSCVSPAPNSSYAKTENTLDNVF